MKRIFSLIIGIVFLGAAFTAGMWWQKQLYLDICLDLGGGMNPGDYPICVIEKTASSELNEKQISYACSDSTQIEVRLIEQDFVQVSILQQGAVIIQFSGIHSISASGAKYDSSDKQYVYWTKGDECMIMKNDEIIYSGCKEVN